MGWKAIAAGAGLGALVGGPFGAVLGAALAYDFDRRRERRRAAERAWRGSTSREDSLRRAYATLGADPSEPLDSIRRRYRELAKRNHPDVLRAQGLPESRVSESAMRMARINAAWSEVRAARDGL